MQSKVLNGEQLLENWGVRFPTGNHIVCNYIGFEQPLITNQSAGFWKGGGAYWTFL